MYIGSRLRILLRPRHPLAVVPELNPSDVCKSLSSLSIPGRGLGWLATIYSNDWPTNVLSTRLPPPPSSSHTSKSQRSAAQHSTTAASFLLKTCEVVHSLTRFFRQNRTLFGGFCPVSFLSSPKKDRSSLSAIPPFPVQHLGSGQTRPQESLHHTHRLRITSRYLAVRGTKTCPTWLPYAPTPARTVSFPSPSAPPRCDEAELP